VAIAWQFFIEPHEISATYCGCEDRLLRAEDHGSRASVTLDNAECRKSKERVQRANGLPSHSCYLTDTGSRERDGSAGTISAQGDIDLPEAMQEGRGAADRANRKRGRRPSAAGGKKDSYFAGRP